MRAQKEQGFSLIEMLVAMVISGVLMLGAMQLIPQLQGLNLKLLAQLQLNEELHQIMMTLEKAIHRAGYCHGQCHGEGLQIDNNGQCILIKWDENSKGRWRESGHEKSDFYGYRLGKTSLEMQRGASHCQGGGWERISDPRVITITRFHVQRVDHIIKLILSGHASAYPSRSVTLEHWVNGMNLS